MRTIEGCLPNRADNFSALDRASEVIKNRSTDDSPGRPQFVQSLAWITLRQCERAVDSKVKPNVNRVDKKSAARRQRHVLERVGSSVPENRQE
jgi:hypothetical protein